MKAAENQLLPFLEGKKQFIIPIYQRTYSWSREQCEQLWNDIVRTGTDKETTGHFVGSIVFIQRGLFQVANIPQLLVIDGQQRLTTLSLLLVALAKAIQASTTLLNISHEDIYDSYLTNKHGKEEQHYKLLLTQSDKDTLIQLIDDPKQAKSTGIKHRILENYLFFEDQIRQSGIDLYTLYVGISRLIIVEISLDKDHDNPQLIFESLNSTGMDLSQADLIRNYVLMGLDSEEQTKLYKSYWFPMEQSFRRADGTYQFDRFMRDYLTVKQGTIPNIDKVYVSFKSYQRSRPAAPIKEIVVDIYQYAEYFTKLVFLRETDSEIKQVLSDISTLQVNVVYPFLLEVYDDYKHQLLSREDFIALLKLVESYVFRRAICGISTNGLNKIFATLTKEIDKERYLESVQASFFAKIGSGRFPRDEDFRNEFVVKDVYNLPSRSRHYLLNKLENHERKERVNIDEYTIEHIMPQNEHLSLAWQQELGPQWQEVHAQYLHTIGNLTLTGYNSELSDRPFAEKREMDGGFVYSPIHLNKSLAKLEHWNKHEIEKRSQAIAELAIKIWPIPQLSVEQLSRLNKRAQKQPLLEVIGPIEHAQAGFIPAGFKVIQISEKRFLYLRNVQNRWIHYGTSNNPWYALSWENVGRWLRDFEKKNTMPQGPLEGDESGDQAGYSLIVTANGNKTYTLDDYVGLQGNLREVFEHLRKRILNLDAAAREVYTKFYIAYKTTTNFVDIEPQKKRLRLALNMTFSEIDDPKGLCKDMTGVGHYGNGDVEISVTALEQLDDVMALVRQSFERHWEESDV